MLAFNFFKPSWALLCTLHVCMSLLLADAVHQNPQPILLLSRTIQSVSRTLFASGLFNTIWMLPNSMQAAVPSQSHSSPAGPEKVVRVVNQPGCQYKIEFRPNTSAVEEVPPVYPMCVRPRGPMSCQILSNNEVALQKRGLSRGQSELLDNDLTNDDPPQLQWEEEVSEEGSARKWLQNELNGQEGSGPGEPCRLDPMKLDPGFDRLQAMLIGEEILLRMSMLESRELLYKLRRTTLLQIYFQLWALYKDVLNWICDVKCQRPKKDEKEVSNRPNALGQLEATNMSQNCQFEGRLRMEKSLQEADSGKSRLMLVIQLSNQPGNIVHVPLVLGFPHLGYLVEQNAQVTGVQSTSVNITCHKQAD